jgi:CheY-like chemotaxis protein
MGDILIIDDDEMMVEVLSELLADEGYAVRSACNGWRGLAEVERRAPDLIVLDMNMPIMDGFALAREVRVRPCGQSTRILAVTGDTDTPVIRATLEAGCDAFVGKPFDADDLIAAIRGLLDDRTVQTTA